MTDQDAKKPRRPRGTGGLHYREKDGMWIGTAYLIDRDGKRVQKRVAAKSKTAAATKLRNLQTDIRKGRITAGRKDIKTVGEWMDYWLNEIKKPKVAPSTLKSYSNTVRLYIKPHIGSIRLDKLTPADVRSMLKNLLPSTRNQQKAHMVLKMALRKAVVEELVDRDVTEAVDKPEHKKHQRGAFESGTAVHVLKVAGQRDDSGHEPKLASRWAAAFMTGARRGELLGLEWDRVDLDAGVMDIQWQLVRLQKSHGCGEPDSGGKYPCGRVRYSACPDAWWDFKPSLDYRECYKSLVWTRPKSKAGARYVPLAPPLLAALKVHREMTAGLPNPRGLVWHHSDGRPISPEEDQAEWDALMAAAGVSRVNGAAVLHEARNTAATRLLEAGVDVRVIQEILGHASILQTRDYQRVSLDLSKAAVASLGSLLAE